MKMKKILASVVAFAMAVTMMPNLEMTVHAVEDCLFCTACNHYWSQHSGGKCTSCRDGAPCENSNAGSKCTLAYGHDGSHSAGTPTHQHTSDCYGNKSLDFHSTTCGLGTAVENQAHSGGTATCVTKATCEVCGIEYGEFSSDHDWSNNDGFCARTGCDEECLHTGQQGTTCVYCGKTLSSGHQHSWGNWEANGMGHWKVCNGTGQCDNSSLYTGLHDNAGANGGCSVCGYGTIHDHTSSCYVNNGNGTHSTNCGLGTAVTNEGHSGGTATCQSKKVCIVCTAEYGSYTGHNWGEWNASTGKRSCQTSGCSAEDTCDHDGATTGTCETCSMNLGGGQQQTPTAPTYSCTTHSDASMHAYSYGTTFSKDTFTMVSCYVYRNGDVYRCLETGIDRFSIRTTDFVNGYTEGWYYFNGEKFVACDGHISSNNTPSTPVVEESKPAPTPEPVVVVVDETKLPVEIVKNDKTDVHNVIAEDVTEEAYNLSQFTTIKGFAYGLETAVKYEQKKNETAAVKSTEVEVYTGYAYTFGKSCIDVFKNSNVDVVYLFMHKGNLFKVTIPAGTDIESLLDENGFAGPLWIGKQLGTVELIK